MKKILLVLLVAMAAYGVAQAINENADTHPTVQVVVDDRPLQQVAGDHRTSSYADVLEKVTPAVVSVFSTKIVRENPQGVPELYLNDPFFRRFFGLPAPGAPRERREQGLGSGVVVSVDGYILTNNHVIEDADEVRVGLQDGRELDATIIGSDPKTDLAVLKVEVDEPLPTLVLADSDQLRVGDLVFAVGNPLRVGLTVTQGIISALNRTNLGIIDDGAGYENFIQTDASINPGNSGGALVDASGRLVGINTAILSRTGGNIGIGFAIPSNLAKTIMMSLVEKGTVERGYLGVVIADLDVELAEMFGVLPGRGALINEVAPDTPAQQADLQNGDVVVSMDGKNVLSAADFRLRISQAAPGTEVMLQIIRQGDAIEVPVTLGSRDAPTIASGEWEMLPGVSVGSLNDDNRGQFEIESGIQGVVVVEVEEDSPFRRNLAPGVVILSINHQKVGSLGDARQLLKPGQRNLLYIYFRGNRSYLVVRG